MIHRSDFPYHALSVEERLLLVEDIWDSIAAEQESAPLTEAQREELARRLAKHDADPSRTVNWDEVKQRIETLRQQRAQERR